MKDFVYQALDLLASRAKGYEYRLDRSVPLSLLLGIAFRRFTWLGRGDVGKPVCCGGEMLNSGRMAFFLAWLISRVKGAHYVVDERIPASALLSVAVRRMVWLLRGSTRALILQRKLRLIFMGPGALLQNASMIRLGRAVTLGPGSIVDGLAEQGVELADNVTIGAYSIVRATGVLTKLGVGVRIGRNSSVDAYSFIGAAGGVFIGENVIMGQHISFHAEDHNYSRVDCPIRDQGTQRKGIVVKDDCWVGSNVTFLDGVHVGRGCVIGAGAVVRGTIPDYSIAVGVPARVIGTRGPCGKESAAPNPELVAAARRSG